MKPFSHILPFLLFVLVGSLTAQDVNQRVSSPRTYAANNELDFDFIASVDATFPESNHDLLHAYVDPDVALNPTYLLKGNKIDGKMIAAFPKRFERVANAPGTSTYAAAAIRGNGENLYVVRFDGPAGQRIELFKVNGNQMEHVANLAFRDCDYGGCRQLDTYLTDVDMDGRTDLVQISRRITKNNDSRAEKQRLWLMTPAGKFKRSKMDIPQNLQNGLEYFGSDDYNEDTNR